MDSKADEAAIRGLIAKEGPIPHTADLVAWSGALKRPVVGSQTPEFFPDSDATKRKNQKTQWTVHRLEVAASGDIAWEFSDGKIEYDLAEVPRAM